MKKYISFICLLLLTSTLFAQKSDSDDRSESVVTIETPAITNYFVNHGFTLYLTQFDENNPLRQVEFTLRFGNPENPNNDFRWTQIQLLEALGSVKSYDDNGNYTFLDNISVRPINALDNDEPDHQFRIGFDIYNKFNGAISAGLIPIGEGKALVGIELFEGENDEDTHDGCGDLEAEVEGYDTTSSDTSSGEDCPDFEDGTGKTSLETSFVLVYPNPTSGILYIELNDEIHSIQLFDSSSRLVKTVTDKFDGQLDLSSLPIGVYQLRTLFSSGYVDSKKVIVTN